ncbi:MAG: hypothetical protein KC503_03010 [Myxococcales bacterium]|nr:hypothetical protein [Myxococcales bacterium]
MISALNEGLLRLIIGVAIVAAGCSKGPGATGSASGSAGATTGTAGAAGTATGKAEPPSKTLAKKPAPTAAPDERDLLRLARGAHVRLAVGRKKAMAIFDSDPKSAFCLWRYPFSFTVWLPDEAKPEKLELVVHAHEKIVSSAKGSVEISEGSGKPIKHAVKLGASDAPIAFETPKRSSFRVKLAGRGFCIARLRVLGSVAPASRRKRIAARTALILGAPTLRCPKGSTATPLEVGETESSVGCVDAKGQRVGLYRAWDIHGWLSVMGRYREGKRHGYWRMQSGRKLVEAGVYKRGEKQGFWKKVIEGGMFEVQHGEVGGRAPRAVAAAVKALASAPDKVVVVARLRVEGVDELLYVLRDVPPKAERAATPWKNVYVATKHHAVHLGKRKLGLAADVAFEVTPSITKAKQDQTPLVELASEQLEPAKQALALPCLATATQPMPREKCPAAPAAASQPAPARAAPSAATAR